VGWKLYQFIGLTLSYSRWDFQEICEAENYAAKGGFIIWIK
jgi:hypothetical protein